MKYLKILLTNCGAPLPNGAVGAIEAVTLDVSFNKFKIIMKHKLVFWENLNKNKRIFYGASLPNGAVGADSAVGVVTGISV